MFTNEVSFRRDENLGAVSMRLDIIGMNAAVLVGFTSAASNVGVLAGKQGRIWLTLKDADLYAFQCEGKL